jgi:hypothetical protein
MSYMIDYYLKEDINNINLIKLFKVYVGLIISPPLESPVHKKFPLDEKSKL